MSDLKRELQQLAEDAARHARPLPVAEVIRQGDQWHPRLITLGPLRGAGAFRRVRPGWRRALTAGLTAAVAAGALTAVAVTSSPGAPAVRVITVARLTDLAATAAARQPEVRPDQWVYREMLSNGPGGHHPRFSTAARWATADGSERAAYQHGKLRISRFPAGLVFPYRSLGSLPTDPRALVARLAQRSCNGWPRAALPCPRSRNAFISISNMFSIYVMPPKITADLYRALGAIPGVTIDKKAADIAGHRGIGFAYPLAHKTIQEIIVNSRTYTYMGSYFGPNVPASKADGEALVHQTIVSGPGVRP